MTAESDGTLRLSDALTFVKLKFRLIVVIVAQLSRRPLGGLLHVDTCAKETRQGRAIGLCIKIARCGGLAIDVGTNVEVAKMEVHCG